MGRTKSKCSAGRTTRDGREFRRQSWSWCQLHDYENPGPLYRISLYPFHVELNVPEHFASPAHGIVQSKLRFPAGDCGRYIAVLMRLINLFWPPILVAQERSRIRL